MDAGVVDQDLYGARFEQDFECAGRCAAVGDVKGDSFGTAACADDIADDGGCFFQAAVGMDDDVVAVSGEAFADRRTDAAAARLRARRRAAELETERQATATTADAAAARLRDTEAAASAAAAKVIITLLEFLPLSWVNPKLKPRFGCRIRPTALGSLPMHPSSSRTAVST